MTATQTPTKMNNSKLRRIEKALAEVGFSDPTMLAAAIVKITGTVESAKNSLDMLYRREALDFDSFVAVGAVLSNAPDAAALIVKADDMLEAEYDRLATKRHQALDSTLLATTENLQAAFWAEIDRRGIDRALAAVWAIIWAYFRVSKDDYRRSTSPRDQMGSVAVWCADNMVFPGRAFHEHAHTAFAEKGEERPVLNRMLDAIRSGEDVPDEFAGLVVLHTDRLARDLELGAHIIKLLKKRGYGLWESDYGTKQELEELEDLYVAKFRQAERESVIKARKIRNKYRNLLREGRVIGNYAQAFGHRVRWGKKAAGGGGYTRYQEKIVPHPSEATLLQGIGCRILGGVVPYHICVELNDAGIRGRNMKEFVENADGTIDEIIVPGGIWNTTRLVRILTSARMIGHVRYDGELWDCTDMLAPLFTRIEWEALCGIFGIDPVSGLKIDSETGLPIPRPEPGPEGRQPTTLGSTILLCPVPGCGSTMALSTDRNGVEWYRCTKQKLRDVSRLHCGECGEPMKRNTRAGGKPFVCANGHETQVLPTESADGERHPAILKTIADALLERVAIEAHIAIDAGRLADQKAARSAGQSDEKRVETLRALLAQCDSRDEAANQLFLMGRKPRTWLETEGVKIGSDRRAYRVELDSLGHGHKPQLDETVSPEERWAQGSIAQRRQMLSELVKNVYACPAVRQGSGAWVNREAGFRFVWQDGVVVPDELVAVAAEELYRARIAYRRGHSPLRTPEEIEERAYELHQQGKKLNEIADAFEAEGILPLKNEATGKTRWPLSSISNLVRRAYERHGTDYMVNRDCYPQAARELAVMKQKEGLTYKQIADYLNGAAFKGIRRQSGKLWDEGSVGHMLAAKFPEHASVGGRTPSVPDEVCLLIVGRFEAGETAGVIAAWLGQSFPELRPRTAPDAAEWEWRPSQIYGLLNRGRRIRAAQAEL